MKKPVRKSVQEPSAGNGPAAQAEHSRGNFGQQTVQNGQGNAQDGEHFPSVATG